MLIAKEPQPWSLLPVGALYVRTGVEPVIENVYRKVDATRARRADRRLRTFTMLIPDAWVYRVKP